MKNAPLAFALVGALLASSAHGQELPPGVSLSQAPVAVSVDADGTATVTLKNGSLYRGALIERIQGDHVTLKTATGEVKTFLWADLALAAAAAPTPVPPPPAKPLEAPGVLVTLTGDEGVHLERVTSTEAGAWGGGGGWGGAGWGGGWGGSGRGGMSVLYGGV